MGLLIIFGLLAIVGAACFGIWAYCTDNTKIRAITIIATVICVIGLATSIFVGINKTENGKRWKKDLSSEFNGGLQRTITVYNQYGDVLRVYEGKMDIQENEGDKIVFVMDNKKYMVYKGDFDTVVVEEHNEN